MDPCTASSVGGQGEGNPPIVFTLPPHTPGMYRSSPQRLQRDPRCPGVTIDDVSEMVWPGLALSREVGVFCLKSVLPVGFEKTTSKRPDASLVGFKVHGHRVCAYRGCGCQGRGGVLSREGSWQRIPCEEAPEAQPRSLHPSLSPSIAPN